MRNRAIKQNKFIALLKNHWGKLSIALVVLIFAVPKIIRYIKDQWAKGKAERALDEAQVYNAEVEANNLKNNAENHVQAPSGVKSKSQRIAKRYPKISKQLFNTLNGSAMNLSVALGYNAKDWRPFFGWSVFQDVPTTFEAFTEDEAEVIRILKKHPGTFPVLEDLYHDVYTKSRSLKKDILEKLSKSDLSIIRKHHKKYGYNWF